MSGAYCQFCDHRCFVYRVLPDGSWSGHMATCPRGAEHDREQTGHDHTTAVNPALAVRNDPGLLAMREPETRHSMTRGFGAY